MFPRNKLLVKEQAVNCPPPGGERHEQNVSCKGGVLHPTTLYFADGADFTPPSQNKFAQLNDCTYICSQIAA
jgi:hypothetical protein